MYFCQKPTDNVVNYKDLMSLVQLTHRAGPAVRIIVCKRVRSQQYMFYFLVAYLLVTNRESTDLISKPTTFRFC